MKRRCSACSTATFSSIGAARKSVGNQPISSARSRFWQCSQQELEPSGTAARESEIADDFVLDALKDPCGAWIRRARHAAVIRSLEEALGRAADFQHVRDLLARGDAPITGMSGAPTAPNRMASNLRSWSAPSPGIITPQDVITVSLLYQKGRGLPHLSGSRPRDRRADCKARRLARPSLEGPLSVRHRLRLECRGDGRSRHRLRNPHQKEAVTRSCLPYSRRGRRSRFCMAIRTNRSHSSSGFLQIRQHPIKETFGASCPRVVAVMVVGIS